MYTSLSYFKFPVPHMYHIIRRATYVRSLIVKYFRFKKDNLYRPMWVSGSLFLTCCVKVSKNALLKYLDLKK